VTSKKRKYPDAETARAAAVAEAAERAERGGARSGVVIADQLAPDAQDRLREIEQLHGSPPGTVMMAGRRLAIEEPLRQGSPSRRHSSSPHQQSLSQPRRLRRVSRPRRPSWHPSYAAQVIPVL